MEVFKKNILCAWKNSRYFKNGLNRGKRINNILNFRNIIILLLNKEIIIIFQLWHSNADNCEWEEWNPIVVQIFSEHNHYHYANYPSIFRLMSVSSMMFRSFVRPAWRRWRDVCLTIDMKWSSSYFIPQERPETKSIGWNYPLVPQKRMPQNCRFHGAHANCNRDKREVNKKWIIWQIDWSSHLRSVRKRKCKKLN